MKPSIACCRQTATCKVAIMNCTDTMKHRTLRKSQYQPKSLSALTIEMNTPFCSRFESPSEHNIQISSCHNDATKSFNPGMPIRSTFCLLHACGGKNINITAISIVSNIPYNIEVHHACNRPAIDQVMSLNILSKSSSKHGVKRSETCATKVGVSLCSLESAAYQIWLNIKCSAYWDLIADGNSQI